MRGGPNERASTVPDRISNSWTTLPVRAELKTMLSPSGMKRATAIVWGSKVFAVACPITSKVNLRPALLRARHQDDIR